MFAVAISQSLPLASSFSSTSTIGRIFQPGLPDTPFRVDFSFGSFSRRTQCWEKPQWLSDAMGDQSDDAKSNRVLPPLLSGLSGFCLDPDQGFVAIFSAGNKFIAATVSVKDKGSDRLISAEALTMVQLAGGLDLCTAILPPDALWQLVRVELSEDGEDEQSDSGEAPFVSLNTISVIPNEDYQSVNQPSTGSRDGDNDSIETNSKRAQAMEEALPQVFKAVQGLAGTQQATREQVASAMKLHANQEGNLDRQGFANLLDRLRKDLTTSTKREDCPIKFVLDVSLVQQDSIQSLSIETFDTFQALGLSMRHKIPLQVAPEALLNGKDASTLLEDYPAFRPIQELLEDAQIMDGFIPSMFEKAKQQQVRPPPSSGGNDS